MLCIIIIIIIIITINLIINVAYICELGVNLESPIFGIFFQSSKFFLELDVQRSSDQAYFKISLFQNTKLISKSQWSKNGQKVCEIWIFSSFF